MENSWVPSESKNKYFKLKEPKKYIPKMYNLLENRYTPRQENLTIDINIGIAASICDLIEFIEFNIDNLIYKPSKLYLYNIVYNYYSNVIYLYDYFEILEHYGICSESSFPFIIENINKLPDKECILEGFKNRNYEYFSIDQSLSQIKAYLLDNIPILFGLKTPNSGIQLDTNNRYLYSDNQLYSDYGNIVIAYGYNDAFQSILIKYPLNTDIGLDGFFWLPYKIILNSDLCNEFTVITKKQFLKHLKNSSEKLCNLDENHYDKFTILNNKKNQIYEINNIFNSFNSNSITISKALDTNLEENNINLKKINNNDNIIKNEYSEINYTIKKINNNIDSCDINIIL